MMTQEKHWYTSSSGLVEIELTLDDANKGHHQGQCDADVNGLMQVDYIKKQLDTIQPEHLKQELDEYGAWDDKELSDHAENLMRVLWIACGDIVEEVLNNE